MTKKMTVRFTPEYLKAVADPENRDVFLDSDIVVNTLAIPPFVWALAKTLRVQKQMLRFPEGHISESAVTLWSRQGVLSSLCSRDLQRLVRAEQVASRVSVEIDVGALTAILIVRMFFMPAGQNTVPILGVIGAVESIGVRILHVMRDSEFSRYLPKQFVSPE